MRAATTARQAGELRQAAIEYTRALRANPSYLPALLGLADTRWELGERLAARAMYAQLQSTLPRTMVPVRVRSRSTGT